MGVLKEIGKKIKFCSEEAFTLYQQSIFIQLEALILMELMSRTRENRENAI